MYGESKGYSLTVLIIPFLWYNAIENKQKHKKILKIRASVKKVTFRDEKIFTQKSAFWS